MTRIAIISTMGGYPWGGSEYLWAAMAEQALLEGHEVFVSIYDWSVEHPLIIRLQQEGAQLLLRPRFPTSSLVSRIYRKFKQQLPLLNNKFSQSPYQPIFDCKPDVICISEGHVYNGVYDHNFITLLNISSTPYLIVSHLNEDNCKLDNNTRLIAQKIFSSANYHVFVSYQNLKLTERQLAQSLPNGIVVQNPVNLNDLSIVPWPYQPTISFASVARLEVGFKGQDILLEILSSPIWKQRNWQCHLYGAGPDQAYLQALTDHYGIAERVKFMDHVNDIRSIWSENHILLLPSRAEGGPPLVVVEAMLCGRPVVATNVGAVPEWIEDGQTGFIAEAPTPKLFDAALNRAWLAQDNWKQMGMKAHKYATNKLDKTPGKTLLKLVLETSKV